MLQQELSGPAILLISLIFATVGMAIYTYAAAASGQFDLANQAVYELQSTIR